MSTPYQTPHSFSSIARHVEPSMVLSLDDERALPSPRLFDIALDAIRLARSLSLSEVSARLATPPFYPDIWPGEHYRLLAALVLLLQPKIVIEIGTSTGLSALALKQHLPSDGKVVTFDLNRWDAFPNTCLRAADFTDGRLYQELDDLTNPHCTQKHADLLSSADLVFVDAAKDGVCEDNLIKNFLQIQFKKNAIFIFDDIRLMNMIKTWREIRAPKLDLTSFGHWSGTGLVEWRWP